MKPELIVAGISMLGFLVPELFAAFGKVRVPLAQNIWCMVAFGLIAYGVIAV